MTRSRASIRNPLIWLLLIITAGIAYRLFYLCRPLDWFVSFFTADDYFYYLNTAWNIAHGNGSSCDGGLTFHNGYHPLFLVLFLPLFLAGMSKGAAVYAGAAILAAANVGAAVLAYRIVSRRGNGWLALCVPAMLMLNLKYLKYSLCGFETMLALALLLLLVDRYQKGDSGRRLGFWLGLAGLARVEYLMVAPLLAFLLVRRRRLADLAWAAVISTAVCSPWFIWSWLNFGTVLPQSGSMKMLHGRLDGLWAGVECFLREIPAMWFGWGVRDHFPSQLIFAAGVLLAAAALRNCRRQRLVCAVSVCFVLVYSVLTSATLSFQMVRYLVPAFVGTALMLATTPADSGRMSRLFPVAPLLLCASLVASDVGFNRWAMRAPALDTYVGKCQRELPPILAGIVTQEDLVGSFDSGSLSYFCTVPVVNLDGLVNSEVAEVLGAGNTNAPPWEARYRKYFRDRGITILVGGSSYSWVRIFKDLGDWEELHPPVESGDGGDILFLRVPEAGMPAQ